MSNQTSSNPFIDRAAIFFSVSCVIHCLLVPILGLTLPLMAIFAEAEIVHWSLTITAVAASVTVIFKDLRANSPYFLFPAVCGINLSVLALFSGSLGLEDKLFTVLGGAFLGGAHLYRLLRTS